MGSLYRPKLKSGKQSARYWVKYYVNGRAVRESTKTDDREAAKRYLKTREGAVALGAPILPRMDRVRYEELAADLRAFYETTGRRRLSEVDDHLAHLKPFFEGRRIVAITPDVLTQYVARRQAEPTKAGRLPANRTINMELALLKRMLRLGVKHGKVLRVLSIDFLKEAPPREGFFEVDQFAAVRRRLVPDVRVAVTIAYTFGWRMKSEVLTLERRHLDLKAGTLRLDPGMTKNGDGRVVYLTPELRGLLAEQLERVDQVARRAGQIIPWLFPYLRGRRRMGQRRRSFAKVWAKACEKAQVPGRILHDFRRTAVRNLERAGVPRSVAMKLTGHKTESVYRRYAIVSDADLREATQRLLGTFPGTSGPPRIDGRAATMQNDGARR